MQQAESATEAPASRWLSAAGNALFFGALGGAAYFGYYTLRYSTPEMAQLIDERKQPEHAFPGSQVAASSLPRSRQWQTAAGRHTSVLLLEEPHAEHDCEQQLACQTLCQHTAG